MANDFEFRLKSLEDREAIFYEFIDELRQDHKDSLKRIEQNEWMIASVVENQRSMIETQHSIVETLGKLSQTVDGLVETQGMIIQILDRMDRKIDDLGRPSKNGHP